MFRIQMGRFPWLRCAARQSRSCRGERNPPYCHVLCITMRRPCRLEVPEINQRNESGTNRGRIADSQAVGLRSLRHVELIIHFSLYRTLLAPNEPVNGSKSINGPTDGPTDGVNRPSGAVDNSSGASAVQTNPFTASWLRLWVEAARRRIGWPRVHRFQAGSGLKA